MFKINLELVAMVFTLSASRCSRAAGDHQIAVATPAQLAVLDSLVRTHAGWRLALPADNTKLPEMRRLGIATPEQPYFSIDSTRRSDASFAVALVKADTFSVYYARWNAGTFASPIEVATLTWLNRGQLVLRGDTLEIAPLSSDEIFTFVWDPTKAAMVLQKGDSS